MTKIYFEDISNLTQADYTLGYSLLCNALRDKIDTKKREDKKRQSLLGYMLFYRAAQELYGKTDFDVSVSKDGKPSVDFCNFSISHSENMVCCAVSDRPIGVDIQKIYSVEKRGKYCFFNQQETHYVNQDGREITQKFFEIFTKKEAALKLLGGKISDMKNIDTFDKKYTFKTEKKGEYMLSICSFFDIDI